MQNMDTMSSNTPTAVKKSVWTLAPGLYLRKLHTASKHIVPKSTPERQINYGFSVSEWS